MSRAIVMKTIDEVSDLIAQEEGKRPEVFGGGPRKKRSQPFGMGLQSYPSAFGMGGAIDMYGAARGTQAQIDAAASNPWISYVKEYAQLNNLSYGQAMIDAAPHYRAAYGLRPSKPKVKGMPRVPGQSKQRRAPARLPGTGGARVPYGYGDGYGGAYIRG